MTDVTSAGGAEAGGSEVWSAIGGTANASFSPVVTLIPIVGVVVAVIHQLCMEPLPVCVCSVF